MPHPEAGAGIFGLAGIAAVGLIGCLFGYRALESAGSDNEHLAARCERSLTLSFIFVAANIATGIAVIAGMGIWLMLSPATAAS